MKYTHLEGPPEEIAEFLRLTEKGGGQSTENSAASESEMADTPVSGTDMDTFEIELYVESRERSADTSRGVLAYLKAVRELGRIEIVTGTSVRTKDGQTDYLMVRDAGQRRYGAVAYVKPANGGLTLRLNRDDVADISTDCIHFRDVREGHKYVVNCPLTSDEAIKWAVELTRRALRKVRGQ
ncbi:hypothetical protein OG912_16920 [Streptomyces sp. NBC_00464]|uniref:hypothetical protein n=1 Tax=Streptomyces sp. NBC_00464 TaxID=2975751 RepID=UPI002E17FC6A